MWKAIKEGRDAIVRPYAVRAQARNAEVILVRTNVR
jgi:hypothetical protein